MNEILELSVTAFIDEDINRAYRVEPLEERIDVLCDEMKLRHVDRLQTGDCSLQTGFVFNDLLTNFERVADHCSNLAIAMIELRDDAYDTHDYVINLKESHAHNFDELYGYYAQKYEIGDKNRRCCFAPPVFECSAENNISVISFSVCYAIILIYLMREGG